MPPESFKFAVIADILLGEDKAIEGQPRQLSSRARSLLRYVVNKLNTEIKPAFVVQLGNLIEPEDVESDEENYVSVVEILRQLKMPVHFSIGDCDQANLSAQQIASAIGVSKLYYSFDAGAYHFVVLFGESKDRSGGDVSDSQRKWLLEDLEKTDRPVFVFIHHPIDDQDLSESIWFKDDAENCFAKERASLRELLARCGKVRAVFNGHVHRNNLEAIDKTHYVSLQSLVENVSDTRKIPSESFAIVTFIRDDIRVEVEGMDPAEFWL